MSFTYNSTNLKLDEFVPELIAKSVIEAILNLSIAYKKPIGNGILTCLNKKQAIERIHKAEEASIAVKKLLLSEVS